MADKKVKIHIGSEYDGKGTSAAKENLADFNVSLFGEGFTGGLVLGAGLEPRRLLRRWRYMGVF